MVDATGSFRLSGAIAPARPDSPSIRAGGTGAVTAPLTPATAVAAIGQVSAAYFEPSDRGAEQARRTQAVASFIENHSHYDASARTVVYQAIDAATEQVVHQFPDDVVLKLRAYFNELAQKESRQAGSDVPHVVAVNA